MCLPSHTIFYVESVDDVIMADNNNVELEEGALNAEEEARVYKGYNGG